MANINLKLQVHWLDANLIRQKANLTTEKHYAQWYKKSKLKNVHF